MTIGSHKLRELLQHRTSDSRHEATQGCPEMTLNAHDL